MVIPDLDGREFLGVVNYDDGDANRDTRFHYHQDGRRVWGTYQGGNVQFGSVVAIVNDAGHLDLLWQYVNRDGRLCCGTCLSVPELLPDGRYRLHETWSITAGQGQGDSGTSVIEEIKPLRKGLFH